MKNLMSTLTAGLLLTSSFVMADDPQPYSAMRNLPATPYYVQDGYIIYDLIQTHRSNVVIDVESQDGSVSRFIAQLANQLPDLQTIYSVDAWKDYGAQKHTFQKFLSNVKHENSANLIVPIRMSSQEASLGLNVTADFITIVGSNDSEVLHRDIISWFTHLSDKGIIAGNNWNENSVEIGVTKAANSLDLPLHINGNVWYILKTTP
jgi:hypothetical protein